MTDEGLEVLQRLAHAGELSPDRVIKEAHPEGSPLHGFFEWDDEKAAHEHRLQQARSMIRSVTIEVSTRHHVLMVPRYVHDPDREEGGYVETLSLVSDRGKALRTLQQEMQRALGCLKRAQSIASAVGMGDSIDLMITQVIDFQAKVEVEKN